MAGLPAAVFGMFEQIRNGDMSALVAIVVVAIVLGFTYFVVFVERGPAPDHGELRPSSGRP